MKVYLKLIVFLYCLLLQWNAVGQDLRLQMTLLNEDDGMENSFVNDVIQDSRGLIWAATTGGLHCYDGYTFTVYNKDEDSQIKLTDNRVTSIVESEDGLIWAGTKDGLNVIDPTNRTATYYFNVGNTEYPSKGNVSYLCNVVKSGDGRIWINEGGKIATFYGDSLKYIDLGIENLITGVFANQNEGVLLSFNEFVSPVFINNSGELMQWEKNGNPSLDSVAISTSFIDDEGDLTFKSVNNKFYKLSPNKDRMTEYIPEPGSIATALKDFINEFSEIDITGSPIKENILFKIAKIFRDESGLVWVATNFGIVKITYEENEFKTSKDLLGISLREMYEAADGKIYMGAYPPFSFFSYDPANDSIQQFGIDLVWPILALNKDTILLGQSGLGFKLFDLNKQEIVFSSTYKTATNFHSLELGTNNAVWFGSLKGLYVSDKNDLTKIKPYKDVNGDEVFYRKIINHLMVDKNNKDILWVATNVGLYQLDQTKGIVQSYFFGKDNEKSILSNEVQDIEQDENGNLWVGSSGGLSYINRSTGNIKGYTSREGLPDNMIFTMAKDNEGILWLGTRNGLSRFDPKEETFTNFYESDGLSYREFNRGSVMKAESGKLYFGGLSGFSSFDPDKIITGVTSFKPFISKYILYNNEEKRQVEIIPSGNETSAKIRLDPRNRNIEFFFAITDYDRPRQSNFQVFLEGFDKGWQMLGNKRSFRYTNLDAGAYNFRVRAANKEGIWSEQEAKMTVVVQEPFWGSDLFFGIILLSVIGVITAFYFARLSYELDGFQLRNRIANDLHDEVSNTLNNIRIISTEAEMIGQGTKELSRIKQMSSNAIEHVQDVIWAIDQDKEGIKYLLFRIEDYVDILLRNNQIKVTFSKENLNLSNPLDFLHRRNLLLICKEAISNMVKHTYCKQVVIEMGNENGKFYLNCINYFDKKKEHSFRSGRGIPSMEQRAEAIGGTLKIEEEEGKFAVSLVLEREL